MTSGWAATNTLRETLPKRAERHRVEKGIEYVYGHKPWHADSIDAAHDALALVEAALAAAVDDLMADGYPVNDPDLDGRDDPAYKDELVRQWGPKKVALAAALRAVREGR